MVVDVGLTVGNVFPGLHTAEVLVVPDLVFLVDEGEEVPLLFLAFLGLEPNKSAILGSADLVNEIRQGLFLCYLIYSQIL